MKLNFFVYFEKLSDFFVFFVCFNEFFGVFIKKYKKCFQIFNPLFRINGQDFFEWQHQQKDVFLLLCHNYLTHF